jgi:predicted glycogen debranching enzyme
MEIPVMTPAPGGRLLRFVGDRVRFSLRLPQGVPQGSRALLRTNLGKAARLRQEIIATHAGKNPMSVAFWRDIAMARDPSGEWSVELPLTDPGFYRAKSYMLLPDGRQVWPEGFDAGVSVHPDVYRTANTIYCAFPRMFGASKSARQTLNENWEKDLRKLDDLAYVVIPPSGKLRDLARELPHIIDTLGCRILQLLPIGPVPSTFARFGRFGSPYACLDLTGIDPQLVEFDKKTNGVGQFCELTREAHRRGARVLLDMVINHTGWGSSLYENHPEWFVRDADGNFVSPGAWGVTWGDLVEMNPRIVELWDVLANAFLTWCRRGVDGFRCDAGYKVPLPVWQYIEARVRQEFPDALFLLEGLGGPLEATEALLTEGGMQWAYSELFQNYSGAEVARCLDYTLRQSERVGVYVHYSETHDNPRLARNGRAWSLLRNRLCALGGACGGFAFTCGVEWLAPENVNVHSSRGLAWGAADNLIPELAHLNRLLAAHPCFFDGAQVARLSADDSPITVLRRISAEGVDAVLVLVNNDTQATQSVALDLSDYQAINRPRIDLLGQKAPHVEAEGRKIVFTLEPGAAYCLAATPAPAGLAGADYRRARAQAAWAITALSKVLLPEQIGACPWRELAARIDRDPHDFLACLAHLDPARANADLQDALDSARGCFPQVVTWTLLDRRRITPVPPGCWLLLRDSAPFRARLQLPQAPLEVAEAIQVRAGYVACFAPRHPLAPMDAEMELERYGSSAEITRAQVRFLRAAPAFSSQAPKPPPDSMILLTNGRGGMARLCVDLGRINSKYDCALGANLDPNYPVDRHVFVKRVRAWLFADGFVTPLNLLNLAGFEVGPPAVWNFVADAGDSRTVELQLTVGMLDASNTTVFTFARQPGTRPADLPPRFDVHVVVRVDIEDRNFHTETHRNGGADHHFAQHCHALDSGIGFAFTPASDRQLRVVSSAGLYHPEPEWSQGIAHPVEQTRGQPACGDAFSPGWFEIPIQHGKRVTLALSAEMPPPAPATLKLPAAKPCNSFGERLALAARDFVVRRGTGRTIIAGYPWFLDWGRDTFIAARGLLHIGMMEELAELLVTFGRFEENGTMPNTIHGANTSNRDTSDAPLWYGVLCEETALRLGGALYDLKVSRSGKTIADVLREIAIHYVRGTPNGVRMDPASALIWSPAHFTWMDTNYPPCTPREGYPVEIQALWIRLLRQLHRLGSPSVHEAWDALAGRAENSLRKLFWLEEHGYPADVLLAPSGNPAATATRDNALRCNFLFPLAFGLFPGLQARRAVAAAFQHLFVPGAMRTLAPLPVSPPLVINAPDGRPLNDPAQPYWGRYQGDEDTQRKPAYHNGTAWPWLLPTGCEALARAWDFAPAAVAAAKACLGSMESLLLSGCLGQLPEILDGDAPHQPRGCDAQAWSVLEALRVWEELGRTGGKLSIDCSSTPA